MSTNEHEMGITLTKEEKVLIILALSRTRELNVSTLDEIIDKNQNPDRITDFIDSLDQLMEKFV